MFIFFEPQYICLVALIIGGVLGYRTAGTEIAATDHNFRLPARHIILSLGRVATGLIAGLFCVFLGAFLFAISGVGGHSQPSMIFAAAEAVGGLLIASAARSAIRLCRLAFVALRRGGGCSCQ